MGNYSSYTDDYTPLLSRFIGTTQNAWVVGGMISIPLGDLFSRATKGRINKQRIKDATHEMILAEENMKLRIIEIYSNIEINLNLLKTRISSVSFYKSQYEIAQQDFIHGRKNYDQLVTPRFNMVKAIDEYENYR